MYIYIYIYMLGTVSALPLAVGTPKAYPTGHRKGNRESGSKPYLFSCRAPNANADTGV